MNYGDADLDVKRALELNDENPLAYFVSAEIQIGRGHIEESLKDCDRALELGYKEAGVYQLRARIYEAAQRFEEALEDCDRAFGLSPQGDIFLATLYEVRARGPNRTRPFKRGIVGL